MCQATWYCAITGLDNYTIACLVGGQRLYAYDFPLDNELVTELRNEAIQFWNVNVKQLIEPEIKAGDTELLKFRADALPEEEGLDTIVVYDDDATENLAEAYCNVRAKEKEMKEVKEVIYAQLMKYMTARSVMTRTHNMNLQKSVRRSCEFDLLEAHYPEAYKECVNTKVSVSLIVK